MHLQGVEGQQLSAVVPELGVDGEQAAIASEVTKTQRELLLGAVHLPQVQEGCQGVDLLSPVGLPTKIIRRVSRSTRRGRPEGWEAAVRAGRQAGVTGRDLFADRQVEGETIRKGGNNVSHVRVSKPTGMGVHGSVCSQLSSQFTPLLNERMLGEKGVKVRS